MSTWMNAVVCVSLLFLFVIGVVRPMRMRNWRLLVIHVLLLFGVAALLKRLFGFPIPRAVVAKSASSDVPVAVALFVCMIFGMAAQFLYDHFSKSEVDRKKLDWGLLVAPVFASPIVFIPLLAALQNAEIDLTQLTAPRIMVFLVAFQNGFFWKEVFDKRRGEVAQK